MVVTVCGRSEWLRHSRGGHERSEKKIEGECLALARWGNIGANAEMLPHNVGAVSAPGHTKCDAHRFVPCAVITRERKCVQRETVAGVFLVGE